MALFTKKIVQEMTTQVFTWQEELRVALGQPSAPQWSANPDEPGPFQQRLALLVQVANGELTRGEASKESVRRIEEALQFVLRVLASSPLHAQARLPDDCWETDLGILVSRVRWWLSADELITISNAAALAFGQNTQANRMKIVRAIDKGLLDWVPDPSVANPQKNRRVLRPQVERLGALRQPPGG